MASAPKDKTISIHSLKEFDKLYFPKSSKRNLFESEDPKVIGSQLARKSLNRVKGRIASK